MMLVDLALQSGSAESMAIPVQQQSRTLGSILHHEAAQNLGSVIKRGLGVAGSQILILNVKESRLVAQRVALLGHFLSMGNGLVVIRHVLLGIFQGVQHILRRDGIQRPSVVHRAAGSLFVQLQEHTAQSRLAAAGLADKTQRLALVDVKGDVLICPDIHLLGEERRLGDREILFQISNGQQFFHVQHFSFLLCRGRSSGRTVPLPPASAQAPRRCTSGCSICTGARTCSP